MANKLSFSAINQYTECGRKYQLHYKKRYRSKLFHSALAFGSAIDESLNTLLETKNVDEAIKVFEKKWSFQYINNNLTSLARSEILVYAETDTDLDLLLASDKVKLEFEFGQWEELYSEVCKRKKEVGFKNLELEEKQFYNYVAWLSLRQKGVIMITSYNEIVMPRIKRVIAVQHRTQLINQDGDEITQILDLIVELQDGSIVLFDNKTSARDYEEDAPATSQQLISYYHKAKDDFGVQAVGFIVLKKAILKNKKKICNKCEHDGSESRAKTCDQEYPGIAIKRGKEVEGMVRCDGDWNITTDPKCYIQFLVSNVTDEAEDLVLSAFDEANHNIKAENYYKNLRACKNGPIICQFYNYCWKGSMEDLVELPAKEEQ